MARAESFRQIVVARAGGACEFCRLQQAATGTTFHLEHVHPRSLGGPTTFANLALCCPGCNLAKSDRTEGHDDSGRVEKLYNPRNYEPARLGWHLHFELDLQSGLILPRSRCGEATIRMLKMNDESRMFARRLQIAAGLIG
jgi:hypothetical protein